MAHKSSESKKRRALYLVRHAIAAEGGDAWPDDTKRPLTSKGAARFRKVVRGLRQMNVTVDLVLTSPLVRARQTADILAEGLKPAPTIAVTATLSPGSSPAQTAEALAQFRKARRIALVGHEPGLGELAAWLIGASAPVEFKKGGVCRIDAPAVPPQGSGRLVWHATPRMLKKLCT
jgi:phosphohistidine phosphatase